MAIFRKNVFLYSRKNAMPLQRKFVKTSSCVSTYNNPIHNKSAETSDYDIPRHFKEVLISLPSVWEAIDHTCPYTLRDMSPESGSYSNRSE